MLMRRVFTIGIFLKLSLFFILYFWDVAITTSGNSPEPKVLRSEQLQPIQFRINNGVSDLEEFRHLEAGISFLLGKYDIKGASIAVTKEGRLLYAKGIGYASVEENEPVEPRHLFRIASVSKLITATAIMKMTELGMLDIDDRVFGPKGILNAPGYLNHADPRIGRITVRHLLNHSAGWNRRNGDPMIQHRLIARELNIDESSIRVPDILRHALKQPLDFDPGSRTSYSNLGYAVLGEIIETVTGLSYESYIREEILAPLGIQEMKIGKSHLEARFENEVRYYDLKDSSRFQSVNNSRPAPLAYGGNDIENLGAAGGWIASPVEILKLVTAIDNETGEPSFLSPETIELMTDIRLSGGHPIGWAGTDGQGNWWRTGSLAGTSALVMRQNDGISWAVFFNSSTYRGTNLPREINMEMKAALNKIEEWPDHDLFYYFETPPMLYPDIASLQ